MGLSVDVRVGDLTHPSLGFGSSTAMVGSDSRDVFGAFVETRTSEFYATYWALRQDVPTGEAVDSTGWSSNRLPPA